MQRHAIYPAMLSMHAMGYEHSPPQVGMEFCMLHTNNDSLPCFDALVSSLFQDRDIYSPLHAFVNVAVSAAKL